ncbi:hypothetical protein [Parasphingorhabdus sp.]|uniref:hypothetical protein n=1 Tax=Parasphingorhabdus sp. TaxID=2709688 RepID=UPI003BAF7A39
MAKKQGILKQLAKDLEAPPEVRRFGSGWLAGFFAVVMAIAGLGMVIALRFPEWFATPELQAVKEWTGFRGAVHLLLLGSYALALLSLLLVHARPWAFRHWLSALPLRFSAAPMCSRRIPTAGVYSLASISSSSIWWSLD